MQQYCEKGGFATERGGKKNQLHLQGFALARAPGNSIGAAQLSNSIKASFPIPVRCGYKVSVKPFEGSQTPLFMLGYIQKDVGEPWFHLAVLAFSQHNCIVGRAIHFTKVSDFQKGRSVFSKKDFITTIHSYWTRNLYPLPLSVSQILRFMICSSAYLPAQTWLTSAQGRGFSKDKVGIHFK